MIWVLTLTMGCCALASESRAAGAQDAKKPTDTAFTLPLTARVVTWPVWMGLSAMEGDGAPPLLELSFGYKKRWFELSMAVAISLGPVFGSRGAFFGMGLELGFYSLRRRNVRLRHGLAFGLLHSVSPKRRSPPDGLVPMPLGRLRVLDILVRLGKGVWLEISPLTMGFPSLYELSLGVRFELDEPASKSSKKQPTPTAPRRADDDSSHVFVSVEQGVLWWQHFEPPVLGSTFGRVGLRMRWFEFAVGFGSPAWATWRARGLYELFLDFGFYSLRRERLRLRHQLRLGMLFHNPPFEPHTWSGVVMHADFCIVALGLGRGFWLELQPFTLSIAPRDQLSSSVALRYEL